MFIRTQTPKGTKDILPQENKQYIWIKNKIGAIFERWTYQQISTPIIEFLDSLTTNLGSELVKKMLKFQDLDGDLLALRPEMTIPIARCVSSNFKEMETPIRLFYIETVFRYGQSYIDRKREFWQAGVELLGEPSLEADGEILALLVTTLREIGLKNFRIDISLMDLIDTVFTELKIDRQRKTDFLELIESKNKFTIEEFFQAERIPKDYSELILKLLSAKKLSEVIELNLTLFPGLEDLLQTFRTINEILIDYDIEDYVFFDFTLSRDISYYTGLIFEISVPESASIIGGGGRYDGLVSAFGNGDLSGAGFALEIDKCLEVLRFQRNELSTKMETRILVLAKRRIDGIIISDLLRKTGCKVAFQIQNDTSEKKDLTGQKQNFDYAVFVSEKNRSSLNVLNLNTSSTENVLVSDIEQLFGGSQ